MVLSAHSKWATIDQSAEVSFQENITKLIEKGIWAGEEYRETYCYYLRMLSRLSIKKRLLAALHGRKRAVFLHIQKTAGTTIINLARHHYGQDMVSHGEYVSSTKTELDNISFVSGHFGFSFARSLIRSRYAFTFLRDPANRILSFYFFARERNPHQFPIYQLCHRLSLEQFLEAGLRDPLVREYIWNHQTWQLAYGWGTPPTAKQATIDGIHHIKDALAKPDSFQESLLAAAIQHLGEFDHVGFTETFKQDRDVILSHLGLPIPQENLIENKTSKHCTQNNLSRTEQNLLKELTRLDEALYTAAWKKWRGGEFRSINSTG